MLLNPEEFRFLVKLRTGVFWLYEKGTFSETFLRNLTIFKAISPFSLAIAEQLFYSTPLDGWSCNQLVVLNTQKRKNGFAKLKCASDQDTTRNIDFTGGFL